MKNLNNFEFWWKERIAWWRFFLPIIFAHKPLCDRMHEDTIQIKNIYLCRSCCVLYSAVIMCSLGFSIFPQFLLSNLLFILTVSAASLLLSYPALYKQFPRWLRDILRFLLGAGITSTIWFLIYQKWQVGLLMASLYLGSKIFYMFVRTQKHQAICEQCPEFRTQAVCSGFQLKKKRMQLYERFLVKSLIPKQDFRA